MKEKNRSKKISNIIIGIACIILIPIFIINIWIMIQANTNPDKVPSVFGYKPFIVLSKSMEEEIYKGDLIITKIVDPTTLQKDDIIAFRDQDGTVTTHRIINIVTEDGVEYFITKGDSNNTQDQNLVEYADVEGIYLFRIPGVGSIVDSLSKPTTIIIVIMIITLLFIIGFSISSKKQRQQEHEEFLAYKKMMEEEAKKKEEQEEPKKKTSSKSKKTTTKNK